MLKQVQLPLEQCDLSRFFDSSVFNRSIKLWVNQSCFTCSKLILAQHSTIFEQHLRDSPPSVLLEDFQNMAGAETAIRDGLVFLYGGITTISMGNIKVLTKFATIYNIRKLMVVCMQFIEEFLTVETVMQFFVILKTFDDDGYPVVPEVIRKFMENHTGPIVDHILKSAENIDDEFLLALLELPSSSILVQRCLKAGILPDPIVDLIFKHSDTINVNFLLHDDKRTYVRLITILKSKARSYQDMEKIIDIQQKCISKMCHPYGSVDSLANPLTPAPSISHMQNKNNTIPEDTKVRVTYQPRSFDTKLLSLRDSYEDEYMMPEELKGVQEKRHNMEPDNNNNNRASPLERGLPPRRFNRDHVTPHHVPEKSFTTRDRSRDNNNNSDFPSSRSNSVSNKVKSLEKTFVAKYPGDELPSKQGFLRPKDESNDNFYRGSETPPEHSDVEVASNRVKSLRISKRDNVGDRDYNKTNYAQVYSKKVQERDKEKEGKNINSYESQTRDLMDQQKEIAAALNKLASQQAIIEHTYDNMSAASSRNNHLHAPPSRSTNESNSARVSRNPSTHVSRRRANSSHGPRIKNSQSGENHHTPTTFYAANSKPPPLPMNPPPSESFFTKGGKEVGPPAKSPDETRSPTLADKRSLELLESNLDDGFLPPGCLPEHDRPISPHAEMPPRDISVGEFPMSPREFLSPSGPLSPDMNSSRAWSNDPPPSNEHNQKSVYPDPKLLAQSAILINKHWHKQKSREKKERKSMKKKKEVLPPPSSVSQPLDHITKDRPRKPHKRPPSRASRHQTPHTTSDNRSDNNPDNRSDNDTDNRFTNPPEEKSDDLEKPQNVLGGRRRREQYHIKHIPSHIPDRELYFSTFNDSVWSLQHTNKRENRFKGKQ